jgi:hypothetical protein
MTVKKIRHHLHIFRIPFTSKYFHIIRGPDEAADESNIVIYESILNPIIAFLKGQEISE